VRNWILAVVLTAAAVSRVQAQDIELLVTPSLALPVGGSAALYGVGGGAELSGTWALPPLPLLHVGGAVGYYALPTKAGTLLSAVAISGAGGVRWEPIRRIGLLLDARAGTYVGVYGGEARMNFFASAAPGLEFQLSPAFRIGAGAEFIGLLTSGLPLYTGIGVRLTGVWVPTAQKPKGFLFINQPELLPVFPILFKYYDTNQIGTVRIENRGKQNAANLKVSLLMPEFMDSAKESPPVPQLKRGESVDVPLYALFSDRILSVTEGTKVPGIITVTYSVRDDILSQERTESIRIYDRNAMTWDDDRKVAAFVTAKDPAVLRLAKEIAGGVREDTRQAGNLEFRVAMALFQGLAAYGVNYVVDPGSSYASRSASDTEVDFIQFPRQTLQYRSGDCDDLTILYCAMMEAVGIETAFITVPGHIYSALRLSMAPQEVARSFQDSSRKFIVKEGKAYLPVETTMISKGFVAAWERGASQWVEAGAKAALYPVRDAWNTYESVGIREADPSLIYPDWNSTLTTYGPEYQKFVLADLKPQVDAIQQQVKSSGATPKLRNRLGVLYARYGMYNEAEKELKAIVAGSDYAPALMNLGNIALLRGNPDAALGFFTRARKSEPRNPAVLAGLARTLYDQKRGADAARALDQLAQVDPDAAAQLSYIKGETAGASRAAAGDEKRIWSNWVE
jgi:tetratricopeptide (TPR) repeat protein